MRYAPLAKRTLPIGAAVVAALTMPATAGAISLTGDRCFGDLTLSRNPAGIVQRVSIACAGDMAQPRFTMSTLRVDAYGNQTWYMKAEMRLGRSDDGVWRTVPAAGKPPGYFEQAASATVGTTYKTCVYAQSGDAYVIPYQCTPSLKA